MLAAAKRSGGRLLLSHFVYQYSGFGTLRPALDVVDAARAKGMDVWMDSGMYTDWATYAGTATFDEQTIKDNSLRFGDMVAATGKYTGTRLNRELYELLRHKYPDESIICYSGEPYEIYEALQKPYAMMSTDAGAYAPARGTRRLRAAIRVFCVRWCGKSACWGWRKPCTNARCCPPKHTTFPARACWSRDMTRTLCFLTGTPCATTPKCPTRASRTPRPTASPM